MLILICQLSILLSNYKKGYDLMCFSLCAKMRLGIADRVRNDKSKFIKDDNNHVLPGSQKEIQILGFFLQIIVWKHKTTLVGIKTRNNYNLSLILFPRKKARKLTIHLLSLLKGSLRKKWLSRLSVVSCISILNCWKRLFSLKNNNSSTKLSCQQSQKLLSPSQFFKLFWMSNCFFSYLEI